MAGHTRGGGPTHKSHFILLYTYISKKNAMKRSTCILSIHRYSVMLLLCADMLFLSYMHASSYSSQKHFASRKIKSNRSPERETRKRTQTNWLGLLAGPGQKQFRQVCIHKQALRVQAPSHSQEFLKGLPVEAAELVLLCIWKKEPT
jgi:hypothetical protein